MTSFLSSIQTRLDSLPGSYRFLYTDPNSLDAHYYFIGLNPAGNAEDPSDVYVPSENAFLNEYWAKDGKDYNPLQKQVLWFYQHFAAAAGIDDWKTFMSKQWLISNYVFYRSACWNEMAKKTEHIALSKSIWKDIFARSIPKVIVCNGYEPYTRMMELLKEFEWNTHSESKSATPWDGPHISTMTNNGARCLLVGFPHLSTYKIMGREKNRECLNNVFNCIKEAM
jgi:hypothetical protein